MGSAESGPSVDFLQDHNMAKVTYANNPTSTNKDALLDTNINKVSVVIQQLGDENDMENITRATISSFVPIITTFSHAGLFVYGNNSNPNGVFVEYGAYDIRRSGDYNTQIHYFRSDNGLRFSYMNIYSIPGFKFDCDVQNKMTIRDLCTCLEYHHWTKQKYNVVDQNCQLFVRKAIKLLGSRRINKSDRIRTFSKGMIPKRILDALEENEGNHNYEERIPIIGRFVGFIKLATAD